eukprot:IDg22828t1
MDDWSDYHEDVCFLNVLVREILLCDALVKLGASAEIQPLLAYPALNIPVAAVDKPGDASDKSPVPAADVEDAMVSILPDPSLTEFADSLPLDPVALYEVLREYFPSDDTDGYINSDYLRKELIENPSDLPYILGNAPQESVMGHGSLERDEWYPIDTVDHFGVMNEARDIALMFACI